MATHAASEYQLFPTYTYESYVEKFGVPPPEYNPKMPAKHWADPTADPNGFGVKTYYVISSDQSVPPTLQIISAPDYIAALYNIPTQEWEVTPDKNPNTYPVPMTEEFAQAIHNDQLEMRWQMGILVIEDVLPPDQTVVNWTQADANKLDYVYKRLLETDTSSAAMIQSQNAPRRPFSYPPSWKGARE